MMLSTLHCPLISSGFLGTDLGRACRLVRLIGIYERNVERGDREGMTSNLVIKFHELSVSSLPAYELAGLKISPQPTTF